MNDVSNKMWKYHSNSCNLPFILLILFVTYRGECFYRSSWVAIGYTHFHPHIKIIFSLCHRKKGRSTSIYFRHDIFYFNITWLNSYNKWQDTISNEYISSRFNWQHKHRHCKIFIEMNHYNSQYASRYRIKARSSWRLEATPLKVRKG
jgi:hypothetical protein